MRVARYSFRRMGLFLCLFVIALIFSSLFVSCTNSSGDDSEISKKLLVLSSQVEMLELELQQLDSKMEQLSSPLEIELELDKLAEEIESLEIQLKDCLEKKSKQED